MRIITSFLFLFFGLIASAQNAQKTTAAFTAGNLVVYRVGDGSATLSNAATAVFLDEYTTAGTLVQSIPLPVAVSGANKIITASGSATSEGLITRSFDKRFLIVTGYNAAPGISGVASTASATTERVVGVVDALGNIDATTALTDAYSANNIRGAASTNGNDIWTSGTATTGGSVRYITKGSTTSTQLSTTLTNIRAVGIQDGQLYCSSASGTFFGVSTVGTGLPTTSGQTITLLNGFPSSTASSYAFSIKPTTNDVIYVADDRATASGGGIQKWTLSAGTWTNVYTLSTNLTAGARGLTVSWQGTNPVIYAATTDGKIVTTIDNGASASFTTIATAATNTAFRGIAFSPTNSITPLSLSSFSVALNNSYAIANWTTKNETSVSHFEIERSNDALSFNKVGSVPANNQTSNAYSFTDFGFNDVVQYYRLKMVDKDGSYTYSNIIRITNKKENSLSIYPNPASNYLVLNHGVLASNTQAFIVTADGKTIASYNLPVGSVSNTLPISQLSVGKYSLIIQSGSIKKVTTFIKM
jgi:hypothetical protein